MNTPAPAVLWLQSGYRQGCPPPPWLNLPLLKKQAFLQQGREPGRRQAGGEVIELNNWCKEFTWRDKLKSLPEQTDHLTCFCSCTDVKERDSAVARYKLYFYCHYNVTKYIISFGENMQSYQAASNESINKNEQHRKELLYSCLAWLGCLKCVLMINRQQALGLPPSTSWTVGADSVSLPRNMKQTCKCFNTENHLKKKKKCFKCSQCKCWVLE